ncbi:phospholipid-transporting ATPase ABCA3-like [Amphiura filiformis]|uniref:phospholipid-transporting ATPase ABCA3-like n=1 Tax=Amphiura filiformis TaxID=82378 RepID=UPI003B21D0D3
MGRRANQFVLLLWKNYTLQKRKVISTIFEIGLPVLISVILIAIRTKVDYIKYTEPTLYDGYSIQDLPGNLSRNRNPVISLPSKWQMAYSPNVLLVDRIMEKVVYNLKGNIFKSRLVPGGPGFDTEDIMLEFIANQTVNASSEILGGITFYNEFNSLDRLPTNITYSIRLKSGQRNIPFDDLFENADGNVSQWKTDQRFPAFQLPGPREKYRTWGGSPGYMREGFLSLQHAVDKALIQSQNLTTDNVTVNMRRYPYPPYNDDLMIVVIQTQFPFLVLVSLVFTALNITRSVVHEKERKLKESMKMMGLNNWLHWVAWFLKYLLFLFISVFLMTLFYSVPVGDKGAVINNSDPTCIFVFFFMFSISTIALCFMLSAFFSTANTAAAVAGIVWFFSYVPYFFLQPRYSQLSQTAKISSCLLSNTAMSMGTLVIGMFEGTGAGIQWSNINSPISVDDQFTFFQVLLMMGADTVIYFIITWYVEGVFPGDYGVPKPWYFPVMKSYWCGYRLTAVDTERQALLADSKASYTVNSDYFEREPVGLPAGVVIKNLKKVFKGDKVAVNGISLNMYEGQITALLGHNGAGKTTTMSMVTGLIPPTSGTAVVNNYDIRTDIDGVRSSLGLCPQHDVLFDELTVEEHLYFFAVLKDCPKAMVQKEIDRYITSLALEDKRHERSKNLSGGMKRKLSVGIALIGDSKIVMLDEPTSGMDPNARRFTWDLLQRHRQGRTILLTTHHMDEADLLGDRIAIMAEGELQCCGTSLFLKNKYGVGYHLSMAINRGNSYTVDPITNIIKTHVPNAALENNVGAELSYVLPHESVASFEKLFLELEQRKQELGITSYGASVTTMEEVFLRVGDHASHESELPLRTAAGSMSSSDGSVASNNVASTNPTTFTSLPMEGMSDNNITFKGMTRNTGISLYFQQFWAMFLKKVLHTWRNLLIMTVQLLIPLASTAVALIAAKTQPQPSDSPAFTTSIGAYGPTVIPYFLENTTNPILETLADDYTSQFEGTKQSPLYVNDQEGDFNMSMIDYIVYESSKNLVTFNRKDIVGANFEYANGGNSTPGALYGTAFFNNQPYHSPPCSLNAIDNALLKYYFNESYSITTINHPLPRDPNEQASDQLNRGVFTGFAVAFNMLFGMSFLASSFLLFLVKERANKAKHVQFVSGVYTSNFWFSTFLWDLINYTIPCILICILFVAFSVEAYAENGRIFEIFLLLFLHGWSVIPLMYLFAFLFDVPSTAFVRVTLFNIIFGTVAFMAVEILAIPELELQNVGDVLTWFFLFSPAFDLGEGLASYYNNHAILQICDSSDIARLFCESDKDIKFQRNYMAWEKPGIGRYLTFMAFSGVLYLCLVFLAEMGFFRKIWYTVKGRKGKKYMLLDLDSDEPREDEDVARERFRILQATDEQLLDSDALVLRELRKVYPGSRGLGVVAVDRTSLGIPGGECFGLLGINGAGKTTTFKMLTGDEAVTSGEAFVDGFSIKYNLRQVDKKIGYCPQFDALIDQMTGRETLTMYARLRGMPESAIPGKVKQLLRMFNLDVHADKQAGVYSGGNKRKLSTAIALIGDAPIVFLDEPSTGMDPVTRRLLWDALCQIRNAGRCIVLTSHSMEECEALCTRLAIMVNGQVKCLGSTQHLKSRFGKGYTLLAKVASPSPDIQPDLQPLKQFIERTFPGSHLKDEHQGMVHYHITNTDLAWAQVFGTMERAKDTYNINDYSVSQTTLEQVFLNFARMQREDERQD